MSEPMVEILLGDSCYFALTAAQSCNSRKSSYQKGTILHNRQSVQESTTVSVRQRHAPTKQRHESTMKLLEQSRQHANAPPDVPDAEVFIVTARGRVRTQDEMQVRCRSLLQL